MTASRRARVPTVTEVELQELLRQKKPIPSVTVNTLYLEWFSERNGYEHIYHYAADGKLINQVTSGERVMLEILRYDK